MSKHVPETIDGPAAWLGTTLTQNTDWIRPVGESALAEIDEALKAVEARGLDWHEVTAESFPLPRFSEFLHDIAEELENGRGVVKLTGLPVDRYPEDSLRRLYYGIGCHIGIPIGQNGGRGFMRDIRDSGGQRVDSSGALRWHNDRTDVVALLCVRRAENGGVSRIVSAVAIHDAIVRQRPDLAAVLYEDYYRSTPGDEVGTAVQQPYFPLPIFALHGGCFSSHYSRTYIEQAQRLDDVPRLTEAQMEALDLLQDLAEELCFEMPLAPGDLQMLNNHVIYHGRTPFTDNAAGGMDRLLYRLWLSMPNSRPLPESQRALWGRVDPGAAAAPA